MLLLINYFRKKAHNYTSNRRLFMRECFLLHKCYNNKPVQYIFI